MSRIRIVAPAIGLALGSILAAAPCIAEDVPYGSNEAAAHRLHYEDAQLYYEVYGEGPPVLLLHGGLYGYIDEFASYIQALSGSHTVIAPAMRGHGRSGLGSAPFSYDAQAREALAVLREVTGEPAVVIGFSHGAKTAYALAASHPEAVKKLVAIGNGSGTSQDVIAWAKGLSPAAFNRENPGFVAARKSLTPEPERWDEFLARLKEFYASGESPSDDLVRTIQCPTLIIGGDRDFFNPVENFVRTRSLIPGAQIAIVPDCDHVGSLQRPMVLRDLVLPFVER